MSRPAPPPRQWMAVVVAVVPVVATFLHPTSTCTSVERRRRPVARDLSAPPRVARSTSKSRPRPTRDDRRRPRQQQLQPRRRTSTNTVHCTTPYRWCRSHWPSPAASWIYFFLASVRTSYHTWCCFYQTGNVLLISYQLRSTTYISNFAAFILITLFFDVRNVWKSKQIRIWLNVLQHKLTRSLAVAVIADRTVYDVRYSYRLLSGIAAISRSI